MNLTIDLEKLKSGISRFNPKENSNSRFLSIFSAAITTADEDIIKLSILKAKENSIIPEQLYEIVLQSYLFLGFPKMLTAAEYLDKYYPSVHTMSGNGKISTAEADDWYNRGIDLCQSVYKNNFEPLKVKVEKIAPEIFRWMVFEGYGKVLSRPELSIKDRELSIIAFLMMENMVKQLHSHILGALNVGVEISLIKQVVEDIGQAAGDGYFTAGDILNKVGKV